MDINEFAKKYNKLPTEVDPDYLRELQHEKVISKFQILDLPLMAPGKCSNCGSTKTDRKYVDFGLSIDYYGVVYLCTICLEEVARLSGIIRPIIIQQAPEARNLDDDLARIKKIHEEYLERTGQIMTTIAELKQEEENESDTDLVEQLDSDPTDSKSDLSLSVSNSETQPSSATPSETKQRVAKSPSSSRRKNIPSLTELLDPRT